MMETNILTDGERKAILSMAKYWREVAGRDDTSPLDRELEQVYRILGRKILWIVAAYATYAAAPELAEALREALAILEDEYDMDPERNDLRTWKMAIDQGNAALAQIEKG